MSRLALIKLRQSLPRRPSCITASVSPYNIDYTSIFKSQISVHVTRSAALLLLNAAAFFCPCPGTFLNCWYDLFLYHLRALALQYSQTTSTRTLIIKYPIWIQQTKKSQQTCLPTQSSGLPEELQHSLMEASSLLIPDGCRVPALSACAALATSALVTICLVSSCGNLVLTAGRVDMNHLSPSRLCSSLRIVPVCCVIWLPKSSAPLCRMPIVSAALGVITLCRTAPKCFLHHGGRHAMDDALPAVEKQPVVWKSGW